MAHKIGEWAFDSTTSQPGLVVGLITQAHLIKLVRVRFRDNTERLVQEAALIPSIICFQPDPCGAA